jgi:type IV pilus assembly protein PilZ
MTTRSHAAVLEIWIKDVSSLHAAYMSFLRNGGLFISTTQAHKLGARVRLLLTLLDEPAAIPIEGRVVWVTPEGAQGNRPAGIGVEFSEESEAVNAKIENYLGGTLSSDRLTHTL